MMDESDASESSFQAAWLRCLPGRKPHFGMLGRGKLA